MEKAKIISVFAELGEQLGYLNDDATAITEKYLQGEDIDYETLTPLINSIRFINTAVRVAKNELLLESEMNRDEKQLRSVE